MRVQERLVVQGHRPLDHVPQLPHVPRPGVPLQLVDRVRGEPLDLPPRLPRELLQEVLGQYRDVLQPVPQCRHPDIDDL